MADKSSKKDVDRGKDGKFTKGRSKTGGRDKGVKNHDGLTEVLNLLKDFISTKDNLEKLRVDFQKKFDSNPSGFYYKMVMPLLPKNIILGDKDHPVSIIFNNVKSLPKGDKKK